MQKKEQKDVPAATRSAYQKAMEVVRKNNIEYGIELLKGIVQREPCFGDARQSLRQVEKQKAASMGAIAKFFANLKVNGVLFKGKSAIKKKPLEAMAIAEDVIALTPSSTAGYSLLAEAAEAANALFIAIEALETIRELQPKNEANLRELARIYEADGQGTKVLQTMQLLSQLRPGDLEIEQKVRAAAALATMQQNQWEKEGTAREKVKDSDEVLALEKGDRIVRNTDDINDMIERLEKLVAEGDISIDNRRKLAELYQRGGRHDDAIATYNWVAEKIGSLDPTIDRAIEKSHIAKIQLKIDEYKATGATEAELAKLQKEIDDYRLERAEDRVARYSNDTQLRYDLAIVYWDLEMIDKALEQFQLAQKNPNRRLSSIVYLGCCFHAKKQFDMAVEQFEKAIADMPVMDKDKMNALYCLGVTAEDMGDAEKALNCFKQIYSSNMGYRDVKARIEKSYSKK